MRISVYSFIISAILLTASCSSINKKCKDITFGELSKDVQDTLQCVSQKVIEEDYPMSSESNDIRRIYKLNLHK